MIFLRAYATIPDFINSLIGTNIPRFPINTYGFFVAMAFLSASFFVVKELKRKENLGLFKGIESEEIIGAKPSIMDILIPLLIGAFFGLKIGGVFENGVSVITCQQNALEFIFSLKGNKVFAVVLGLAYAGYTYWSINKDALEKPIIKKVTLLPHQQIGTAVIVAAVTGVIGSNVFEMIQPGGEFQNFLTDPTILFSGLSIYGGLIFGLLGILIYTRYAKLKPWIYVDSISPSFALAYGIGRLGCHFSGDGDWGITNLRPSPSWIPDYFWSNTYAYNVINEGKEIAGCAAQNISGCGGDYCRELAQGVWPTSIYEFVIMLFVFAFTWSLRKKFTKAPAFIMFLVFFLNGIERFFIETIRVTDRYEGFFNLTQAQIISVGLIVVSIVGMIYLWNKHKNEIKSTPF